MACLAATLGLLGEMTDAHSNGVTSVAFAPDGTRIVSGSDNKTLKVWDSGASTSPQIAPPLGQN